MGFGKIPYWIRGGFILLGIYGLINLILIPFGTYRGDIMYWMIPSIGTFDFMVHSYLHSLNFTTTNLNLLIFSSIFYFVIGCFLGYIYKIGKEISWKEFFIWFVFGWFGFLLFVILDLLFGINTFLRGWYNILGFVVGLLIAKLFHKKGLRFRAK